MKPLLLWADIYKSEVRTASHNIITKWDYYLRTPSAHASVQVNNWPTDPALNFVAQTLPFPAVS